MRNLALKTVSLLLVVPIFLGSAWTSIIVAQASEPEEVVQTIEVCFVTYNTANNAVLPTLPSGNVVVSLSNPQPAETTTFSFTPSNTPNRDLFPNTNIYGEPVEPLDTYCTTKTYTVTNTSNKTYTYTQALANGVTGLAGSVLYNDQYSMQVSTLADLQEFGQPQGNEDYNSDGNIVLTASRRYRHLIIGVPITVPDSPAPIISLSLNNGEAITPNQIVATAIGLQGSTLNSTNAATLGINAFRFMSSPNPEPVEGWNSIFNYNGEYSLLVIPDPVPGSSQLCVQVANIYGVVSNIACDSINYVPTTPPVPENITPSPNNPSISNPTNYVIPEYLGPGTGGYPWNPQAGQNHTYCGVVQYAYANNFGAQYMVVEGDGTIWYIIQNGIGNYLGQNICVNITFTVSGSYNYYINSFWPNGPVPPVIPPPPVTPVYTGSYLCSAGSLRSQATNAGNAVAYLNYGSTVSVLGSVNNSQDQSGNVTWYYVQTSVGTVGYIPSSYICNALPVSSGIYNNTGSVSGVSVFNGVVLSGALVSGSYNISQGYSPWHNAVDYRTSCGSPVLAIADGTVIAAKTGGYKAFRLPPTTPKKSDGSSALTGSLWDALKYPTYFLELAAFYAAQAQSYAVTNYVQIQHSNGLVSNYFHLQNVYVYVGQNVTRGQTIGTVGETGWSSSCHLDLQISSNGYKVNPEQLLNTSNYLDLNANLSILSAQTNATGYKISATGGTIHQYCNVYIKDYDYLTTAGDTWRTYTNLIYNPTLNQTFRLRGDIRLAYWDKYSGPCGALGAPTSNDLWAATSPSGVSGAYQNFAGGSIQSSNRGTYAVVGKINEVYTLSGGSAFYGFPIGDRFYSNTEGSNCQWFERGKLCDSDLGDISYKFRQVAATYGLNVSLGKTHQYCGAYIQDYSSLGSYGYSNLIQDPSTGAFYLLTGGVRTTYFDQGGCNKFGLPTNSTANTGRLAGQYQTFTKADIYYSQDNQASKPGIVTGNVRDYYNNAGGTWSNMGFPEGNSWNATSKCNTTGTMQHFNGGKLYMSSMGNYVVNYGGFVDYEYSLGGIATTGWPKGVPYNSSGTYSKWDLENGTIHWNFNMWFSSTDCGASPQQGNDPSNSIAAVKAIQDREKLLPSYTRATGNAGIIHTYACNAYVVDYSNVVLPNGQRYERAVMISDGGAAYLMVGDIMDYYFKNGGCSKFGMPISDQIFDASSFTPGIGGKLTSGYMQAFQQMTMYNQTVTYNSGVGSFGNVYELTPQIQQVYGAIAFEKDDVYAKGLLGMPTGNLQNFASLRINPTAELNNVNGQSFEGGWILYNSQKGRYEKVLSVVGQDALTFRLGSGGSEQLRILVEGMVEGAIGAFPDTGEEILALVLSTLARYTNPLGTAFKVAEVLYTVFSVGKAVIEAAPYLQFIFQSSIAMTRFAGNLIGGILASLAIGTAATNIANLITTMGKTASLLALQAIQNLDNVANYVGNLVRSGIAGESALLYIAGKVDDGGWIESITETFKDLTIPETSKAFQVLQAGGNTGVTISVSLVAKLVKMLPDATDDELRAIATRISGNVDNLSESHLNAAIMIARKGVAVNADELPSLLANSSGNLSALNPTRLDYALKTLKNTAINADELDVSINEAVYTGISEGYLLENFKYLGIKKWVSNAGLGFGNISRSGEDRFTHIAKHMTNSAIKDYHGVFTIPLDAIYNYADEAFLLIKQNRFTPDLYKVTDGLGREGYLYNIKENIGYLGGLQGSLAGNPKLNWLFITLSPGDEVITIFPQSPLFINGTIYELL